MESPIITKTWALPWNENRFNLFDRFFLYGSIKMRFGTL